MTKLILGCGYLGRRVAARWRAEGHRVFGTVRRADNADILRRNDIEPMVCDVLQPESLRSLPSADVVLYCVGLDRTAGQTMRDVYVNGLHNVLNQLQNNCKWMSISSTSVYGQQDGSEVTELTDTNPQEESGRVVLQAELRLRSERPDAIVLRFAGIYGPGRLLRRSFIEDGKPIVADAARWLNLIHVDDGAGAVTHVEQFGASGEVYNVSDGNPVVRRDFYNTMAEQLAAPPPRFVAPDPAHPPPHEQANRRIVNAKLCALGWQPTFATYREGLVDAVKNLNQPG